MPGPGLVGLDEAPQKLLERGLILARRDSGLTRLADLRNRTLITCTGQQMGLAQPWLACQLADEGLPPSDPFFRSVQIQPRISSAMLSVFFGKADACLVALSGFETMAEMNPQLADQLVVLATSPEVVSFVTCIRYNAYSPVRHTIDHGPFGGLVPPPYSASPISTRFVCTAHGITLFVHPRYTPSHGWYRYTFVYSVASTSRFPGATAVLSPKLSAV